MLPGLYHAALWSRGGLRQTVVQVGKYFEVGGPVSHAFSTPPCCHGHHGMVPACCPLKTHQPLWPVYLAVLLIFLARPEPGFLRKSCHGQLATPLSSRGPLPWPPVGFLGHLCWQPPTLLQVCSHFLSPLWCPAAASRKSSLPLPPPFFGRVLYGVASRSPEARES